MNSEQIQLDIFSSFASPEFALVTVRVCGLPADLRAEVAGQLRGPQIAGRRTLPTTVPLLNDRVNPNSEAYGTHLQGVAKLVDPCFWSPDHPALYEAMVEIRQGAATIAAVQRTFGVRWLSTRGSSLILQGERWVVRGAVVENPGESDLQAIKAQRMVLVATGPSDEVCRWASREGLLIAARLKGPQDDIAREVRRLARWAAVGFVMLDEDGLSHVPPWLSNAANMLVVKEQARPERVNCEPWTKLVMCRAETLANSQNSTSEIQLPVIALRQVSEPLELDQARAGCDRLQRDLAAVGDFAGYVVQGADG